MSGRSAVWLAVVVVATVMLLGPGATASADEVVYEGLGPGFWKHHSEEWWAHWPERTISSVFYNAVGPLQNCTLMEALSFGGGPRVEGAQRILLRAAVAAVLNDAHPYINYPLERQELMEDVNRALGTENRKAMLQLADLLDEYNNLGVQW